MPADMTLVMVCPAKVVLVVRLNTSLMCHPAMVLRLLHQTVTIKAVEFTKDLMIWRIVDCCYSFNTFLTRASRGDFLF
jgi:hypothetical protein